VKLIPTSEAKEILVVLFWKDYQLSNAELDAQLWIDMVSIMRGKYFACLCFPSPTVS